MKKVFLSLTLILAFILLSAFSKENSDIANLYSSDEYGRQCCSKIFEVDGGLLEVTACSGSFLTSSASAMTRACAKVDKAVNGIK